MKPIDPRLLRYSRSSRGFLIATVGVSLIQLGLTVLQAEMLARLIVEFFQNRGTFSSASTTILILSTTFIARATLSLLSEKLSNSYSRKIRGELQESISQVLFDHDRATQAFAMGPSEISALVSRGIGKLDGYFSRFIPQLLLAALLPLFLGLFIAYHDLISGVIILLTIPLIPLFGILIGKFTSSAVERRWKSLGVLSGYFLDLISGLNTLRIFGRANAQERGIQEAESRYRVSTMQTLRISFLSSLALEMIATLSVALIAVTIGLRLVNGSITLFTGLLVLQLAPDVYWPIRQVSTHFHAASDGIAVANRILTIVEIPGPTKSKEIPAFQSISWDELTFEFEGRASVIIPSGRAELGAVTFITGESGAGKSTLISGLLGFAQPVKGEIYLVSEDQPQMSLKEFANQSWHRMISWLPQEPRFPALSIKELIQGALPNSDHVDRSDENVWRILQEVGLDSVQLVDGVETNLGQVKESLSEGQKRRIALARALAKPAKVYLLDEPTAGVDQESEKIIKAKLQELSRSAIVIVISHRPALVEDPLGHRQISVKRS